MCIKKLMFAILITVAFVEIHGGGTPMGGGPGVRTCSKDGDCGLLSVCVAGSCFP